MTTVDGKQCNCNVGISPRIVSNDKTDIRFSATQGDFNRKLVANGICYEQFNVVASITGRFPGTLRRGIK